MLEDRLAGCDRARIVAGDQTPLDLCDSDRVALSFGVDLEEEVDRAARPLSDQLESLAGRLGLSGLDEIDRRPADVIPGDLAQAESGLEPGLFDGARPDLNPAPATAPAARGGLALPSRAVRFSGVQKRV